eukprot:TRINITY_DN3739_c0_g2_i3.p1 TRINITY_DN3739_c0_g2~~TRINITY_DN3739_c0_g2_i3.p1  ORF type:complete len:169 (+),score=36.47 TRINITY_DN3739_c0_g2_i3:487-993(+)
MSNNATNPSTNTNAINNNPPSNNTNQGFNNKDRKPLPTKTKSTFVKCSALKPGTKGHNLLLKVLSSEVVVEAERSDNTKVKFAEAVVGDETGSIVLTAKNDQVDIAQPGSTIEIRNAKIDMFKGYMRLVVDKWGKITQATSPATFEVNRSNNLSTVEYELVPVGVNEE